MYTARYNQNNITIVQLVICFPTTVVNGSSYKSEWWTSFREVVNQITDAAGINFAVRISLLNKKLEKVLFINGIEKKKEQIIALANNFNKLNSIVGESAKLCSTKEHYDETTNYFPKLRNWLQHRPSNFKDCLLVSDFSFFSMIDELFQFFLERNKNLCFQTNIHRHFFSDEELKVLKKNLVSIDLERGIPNHTIELQRKIVQKIYSTQYLLDEFIGTDQKQAMEEIMEILEERFNTTYGKFGFRSLPVEQEDDGSFDGLLTTGFHSSFFQDVEPISKAVKARSLNEVKQMLSWEPDKSWHLENTVKSNSASSVVDIVNMAAPPPKIVPSSPISLVQQIKNLKPSSSTHPFAPIVEIISPSASMSITTRDIAIIYRVLSPLEEQIIRVKTFLDGQEISHRRGLGLVTSSKNDLSKSIDITVPERDCEISIIAENKYGFGVPARVQLKWVGKIDDVFQIKPKLYILAIGVSNYLNTDFSLQFPAKDARDFVEIMKKQEGYLYNQVKVKLLTDEGATKEEIVDGLEWIEKQTTSKDVAMVFLAGHGINDNNGRYFFLSVNAELDSLRKTCVPFSEIKSTVESIAGKALFFIDTCHSGNVMGRRAMAPDIGSLINELANSENGVVVFASSTKNQYSLEDVEWNNGAFTKALVEGIGGAADYRKDRRITINMLDLYISERVKELTLGQQTPTTTKPQTIQDFPIAFW